MGVVLTGLLLRFAQDETLLILLFGQVFAQGVGIDLMVQFDNTYLLGDILQLADVTAPIGLLQQARRLFVQGQRRHLITVAEVGSELTEQQRNIFLAFTQRRHTYLHRVQTIIEILPETTVMDRLTHIEVRSRYDAHVRLAHRTRTHAQELTRL